MRKLSAGLLLVTLVGFGSPAPAADLSLAEPGAIVRHRVRTHYRIATVEDFAVVQRCPVAAIWPHRDGALTKIYQCPGYWDRYSIISSR